MRLLLFVFISVIGLTHAVAQTALNEGLMTQEKIESLFGPRSFLGANPTAQDLKQMTALQERYFAALPTAQLLLSVRDYLPRIVASFPAETASEQSLKEKSLRLIAKTFPVYDMRNPQTLPFPVYFDDTFGDRFQVHGIEPDRVAVNTGYEIHFNLEKIIKNKNMTLAEATFLWLHEILHLDQDTPLADRDKWAAKVAQHVKQNSAEKRISESRRILTFIPTYQQKAPSEIVKLSGYASNLLKSFITEAQDKILILEQTDKGTALYQTAYAGLGKVVDSGLIESNFRPYIGQIIRWQDIRAHGVRWNSQGQMQIDYTSSVLAYQLNAYSKVQAFAFEDSDIKPRLYGLRYVLNISHDHERSELNAAYSKTVTESFFEVARIEDHKERRFLSLRVKGPGIFAQMKVAPSRHFIGKDFKSQQLLSLPINHYKALSPDEVQVHLEIPLRNIEPQQILLPQTDSDGHYSEVSIKPLRPETILGKVVELTAPTKVASFKIKTKQQHGDKVTARLAVNTNKPIVGITLDMDHTLQARGLIANPKVGFNDPPVQRGIDIGSLFFQEGHKYYIEENKVKVIGSEVEFEIPEKYIQQISEGPRVRKRIAWAYDFTHRTQYRTVVDTRARDIRRVWLHFADGSIEALKLDTPPATFSLQAPETAATAPLLKDAVTSNEETKILRCEDVFK